MDTLQVCISSWITVKAQLKRTNKKSSSSLGNTDSAAAKHKSAFCYHSSPPLLFSFRYPTTFTFSPLLLPSSTLPSDWPSHVIVSGPLLLTHAMKGKGFGDSDTCTLQEIAELQQSNSRSSRAAGGLVHTTPGECSSSNQSKLPSAVEDFLNTGKMPGTNCLGSTRTIRTRCMHMVFWQRSYQIHGVYIGSGQT
jgi:hypothetical protein